MQIVKKSDFFGQGSVSIERWEWWVQLKMNLKIGIVRIFADSSCGFCRKKRGIQTMGLIRNKKGGNYMLCFPITFQIASRQEHRSKNLNLTYVYFSQNCKKATSGKKWFILLKLYIYNQGQDDLSPVFEVNNIDRIQPF